MIELRKASITDLPEMMKLFEMGIQSLKRQGSPQWQDGYGPSSEKIAEDIQNQESYVLLYAGQIAASAALVKGIDPVYTAITDGHWSGEGPYASIHRVVVSDYFRGKQLSAYLLKALEQEALAEGISDLRIDTYQANMGMQKVILSCGYHYCGQVVFPIPHGERLAYQKIIGKTENSN
jgi:GNAT superfamily N-acetyltransferase